MVSLNPAILLYLDINPALETDTSKLQYYNCKVEGTVKSFTLTGTDTIENFSLSITHDLIKTREQIVDQAVFKIPGVHKAIFNITSITFTQDDGTPVAVNSSPVYLRSRFEVQRFYNLAQNNIAPLKEFLITYNGTTENPPVPANGIIAGENEIKIQWNNNVNYPAEYYELEWAWVDNFGPDNNTLASSDISLSEDEFKHNSTRVQTKDNFYYIPLIFSKGYFIYRVRAVGRFLNEISKPYFGPWSSGQNDKVYVSDWPNVLQITQNYEGNKNWQYQASFAEDGKKKEVVSYFDGSLRNRQTVTRMNTNKQTIVGETIYDTQGRPAIEVLPVPLQQSAIKFYDALNLNSTGKPYSHLDFDWDLGNSVCNIAMPSFMADTSGASKYYSSNNTQNPSSLFQNYVPVANKYPFSQIEYTPDNTGRISRKGGVGELYQLGHSYGLEMRYSYSEPQQIELNRLFGSNVGPKNRYKKNTVKDPNGQLSVSYIDPKGHTIATALTGGTSDNLTLLKDAPNTAPLITKVIDQKSPVENQLATGAFNVYKDAVVTSSEIAFVTPAAAGSNVPSGITFNYIINSQPYTDPCLSISYPFVYNWYVSLRDICGRDVLTGNKSGTYGVFDTTGTTSPAGEVNNAMAADAVTTGTYSLYKEIAVDPQSVENYANDFISKIKQQTNPCYVSKDIFGPNEPLTGCDVSCKVCEEDFVKQYLDQQQATAFSALINSAVNPEDLGNPNEREALIAVARNNYITTKLKATYNNDTFLYNGSQALYTDAGDGTDYSEVNNYVNKYKTEFTTAIVDCRDLCLTGVTLSNAAVYQNMLISDLSIGGQYGDITGLGDESNLTNEEIESNQTDALSIYNDENLIYYGGYTTQSLGESPISAISWRHPVTPYLDSDGNESKILITKRADDTYSPEPKDETDLIPSASPDQFYVKPEKLKYVYDFLRAYEPSWVNSLLPYHPEYPYYQYHSKVSEMRYNNITSDDFDNTLRNIDTFADAYAGTQGTAYTLNSLICNSTGNCNLTGCTVSTNVSQFTSPDPFYNINYTGVEDSALFNIKKQLLQYTNLSYEGARINSTCLSMFKVAAFTILYGNLPNTSQVDFNSLTPQQINANTSISTATKDRIWLSFRESYLNFKEKIKFVYASIYAANNRRYNECIGGAAGDADNFITMFTHYTQNNIYSSLLNKINAALAYNDTQGANGALSICSSSTSYLYADKTKKYISPNTGYNSGAVTTDGSTGGSNGSENLASDAAAQLYLSSGKCPQAIVMQDFLNSLVSGNYALSSLLNRVSITDLPFLNTAFYTQLGGNVTLTNPEMSGSITSSGQVLRLAIGSTGYIDLSILPGGSGCTSVTWNDYALNSFVITQFKDIYYVPGSYNSQTGTFTFNIVAKITRASCTSSAPLEILIQGISKIPVGECAFGNAAVPGATVLSSESISGNGASGCDKRAKFEKALLKMFNVLKTRGEFNSDNFINLYNSEISLTNLLYVDTYGYNLSILPELLDDDSKQAHWYVDSDMYHIDSPGFSLTFNLNGGLIDTGDVVRFTNVSVQGSVITITYINTSGLVVSVQGSFTYTDGFSFECICTQELIGLTAFEIGFTKFINETWLNKDNIINSHYQPSSFSLIQPYFNLHGTPIISLTFQNDEHFPNEELLSIGLSSGCGIKVTMPRNHPDYRFFSNFRIDRDSGVFFLDAYYDAYYNGSQYIPAGTHRISFSSNCYNYGTACAQETYEPLNNLLLEVSNNYRAGIYSFESQNMAAFSAYLPNTSSGVHNVTVNEYNYQGVNYTVMSFTPDGANCPITARFQSMTVSDIPYWLNDPSYSLDDTTKTYYCGNTLLTHDINMVDNRHWEIYVPCLRLPNCVESPVTPCYSCIPVVPSPVTCTDAYTRYLNICNQIGYNISSTFTAQEYCDAQLQYVTDDYINYITTLSIQNPQNPLFLTLQQFASNDLGYGNPSTASAIAAFREYLTVDPQMGWLDYVKHVYMYKNGVCTSKAILPVTDTLITIEIAEPCSSFVDAVNETYRQELSNEYYEQQKQLFKQRFLAKAIENLTETLQYSAPDREYQYTLYYYDQAGNLLQTVPPQGVERTDGTQEPQHTFKTQYKYNSLNQLVWQKTPDGGTTKFAYDDKGRIIASQNEKQQVSFDGVPQFVPSSNYVMENNRLKKVAPGNGYIDAHTGYVLPGDGFIEFSLPTPNNVPGVNISPITYTRGVRIGLSFTNSTSIIDTGYSVEIDQFGNAFFRAPNNPNPFRNLGATKVSDIFRIERKNGVINYYYNYTLLDSKSAGTAPMLIDAALYYNSATPVSSVYGLRLVNYNTANVFSYTKYDALGRIFEAGEITAGNKGGLPYKINDEGKLILGTDDNEQNGFDESAISFTKREVTRTIYDVPYQDSASLFSRYSWNSRKRVTSILSYNTIATTDFESVAYDNAIFYDYDIHGNVRELVSYINDAKLADEHKHKNLVYEYDLISGNVNKVTYQPGKKDQFIHRYQYDADNRITNVQTSKDNIIWENDAKYRYYEHGPLARVELGDKKVQGLDYIYTLQGWLKAVNSEAIGNIYDAGKDGGDDVFAKDAFAFTLNYNNNDYTSRFHSSNTPVDKMLAYFSKGKSASGGNNLYNGNIKEMVTSLLGIDENVLPTRFSYYRYDQLNRLAQSYSKKILYYPNQISAQPLPTGYNSFEESLTYDRNGNIISLNRKESPTLQFDLLNYHYKKNSNQLLWIRDTAPTLADATTANRNDLPYLGQNPYNYEYDNIGQLVKDYSEGIDIEWRVDGKVKRINKTDGSHIDFQYDGLGNRLVKSYTNATGVVTNTYYLRDAQGNPMSTYVLTVDSQGTDYRLKEQDIYGSSRLGVEEADLSLLSTQAPSARRVTNASTARTTTSVPTITKAGLAFTGNNNTAWIDDQYTLNFGGDGFPITKKAIISTTFKIAETFPANAKQSVFSLQGGGKNPNDDKVWNRSHIKLYIKKVNNAFRPVLEIESSRMVWRSGHEGGSLNRKWMNYIDFKTTKTVFELRENISSIPTAEWDLTLDLGYLGNSFIPKLTINDNIFTTADFKKTTSTIVDVKQSKLKAEVIAPNIFNTLGKYVNSYMNFIPNTTEQGAPLQMCEFNYKYTVQGNTEPYNNDFTFDYTGTNAPSRNSTIYSTQQRPMIKAGVDATAGYCGDADLDSDGDGLTNNIDNCPFTFNPLQEDQDHDNVGDVCDNCIHNPNPRQTDDDNDGVGDIYFELDPVTNRQIMYGCDNCNKVPNNDQTNSDSDTYGDVCDNCPRIANEDQTIVPCAGDDQGSGTIALKEAGYLSGRKVGDKRYELSNHLGNVLSVVTDRKMVGGNAILASTPTYLDNFNVPNTTTPAGWLNATGITASIVGNRLQVVTTGTAQVKKNFTLKANTKYYVSLDVELGTSNQAFTAMQTNYSPTVYLTNPNTMQYFAQNGARQISYVIQTPANPINANDPNINVGFLLSYGGTAPANEVTFYIDNLTITEFIDSPTQGYKPDVVAY
ncbi:DUF6443 domain-containing protein, partial [Flavobacterium sp. RNTU_13]|uniref:DUF6443 domain-containing protein n=1 Tax=Flavobacterium sp. RNTU_13 TaxID=3375145 RepID=UPI0039889836